MNFRFDARQGEPPVSPTQAWEESDDDEAAEIRYSLTALGEAVLNERRGRFRGFGPCVAVA